MSPLLLAAWRLWANMAAAPTHTQPEGRVMRSLGVALEAEGVDLGLPPTSPAAMTVHSTSDWDETTCDLSMWDELQPGDEVLDDAKNPGKYAPGHVACPRCYPAETAEQRKALYAHWEEKWAKTPVSVWGPLPGLARHREMAKTVTAEEMDRQIREAMDQMVRNHVRELDEAVARNAGVDFELVGLDVILPPLDGKGRTT